MTQRGYFGIGVYHPKHEVNVGTLMRSAFCFGAAFVFTVGRRYDRQASDTPNASVSIPLYHYLTLDDMVGHLPHSCPLVGVELAEASVPLNRFEHPARACYLLGAEDHGLPPAVARRCHKLVVVPGASHCLNVSVAGSITMYDRCVKWGRAERVAAAAAA